MRKLLLLVMATLLYTGSLMAQKTITGRVTDDKGSPIANVSVTVKGSAVGTTTKVDGTYSITVPSSATALVFSSVDMLTVEVAIGTQRVINTSLKK